jgi:hypothetical protein
VQPSSPVSGGGGGGGGGSSQQLPPRQLSRGGTSPPPSLSPISSATAETAAAAAVAAAAGAYGGAKGGGGGRGEGGGGPWGAAQLRCGVGPGGHDASRMELARRHGISSACQLHPSATNPARTLCRSSLSVWRPSSKSGWGACTAQQWAWVGLVACGRSWMWRG